MTNYICAFNPIDAALKDGAVTVAITISANSEKMARAVATVMLEETYPENTGKFDVAAPIICEAQAGKPAPAGDSFDEHFAKEYEFNGTDWQKREEEMVVFAKTAPVVRIAAIMLYEKTQFTRNEYRKAVDFVHESDEYPQIRNIAKGIAATRTVSLLNEQDLEALVNTVLEKAQDGITEAEAQKLAEEYLFPAEPATGQLPVPEQKQRNFEHNYATLDQEIALALLPGDFDPWEIQPSKLTAAKKLISDEDESWRRWSTEFRIIPTALQIPRETVFAVVREGKELPDLISDAAARKQFVADRIGITPAESSHDQETVRSGPDITEDKPPVAEKQEKTKRTRTKKADKPAEKPAPEVAANDEPATIAQTPEPAHAEEPATDDFRSRAEVIAEVLADTDNLSIWKQVQRTDPRFTKPLEGAGFQGTSINSNYMFMRATEIFGPIGEGWGYEVVEEKFLDGKPLTEPVLENNKQVALRYLRDADGSLFCEQNHSIKIQFWYRSKDGKCCYFESYGATPYRYQTQYGIKVDSEVIKKSLTDAIKKALSMLGFSSDVFMGMHDNPEYLIKNKLEFEIKAASENAEDSVRIREELDEKFTRNTETMRTAVTQNELRGIASTLTREISAHLNSAKSRGDNEYAGYLSGRLRRLTEIEKECLTKLTEKQEADQ
ncbi:hypothetical protein B5724_01090 [Morganella morganii]|uniref:hypothetical protein n=1 Tax=Morganella morganii TaxID=582 RepID=UPI000B3FFF80|nr:hypothetical protein [Morganella morganii]OVF58483.1 hypothetical protein B5724_01090 [Morganella morganii]HCD1107571.1 hypothetical protein [Morganella morganii]HCD1132045.1 hypothetical protein [Morganella morganii]